MEDKPRNLRHMLAEAKDLSELMVDLAYAALYFGDPDMGEEVSKLEAEMSDLVQEMRTICIMAVRDPREAEEMAAVLQVVSAIERIANDAEDIASIIVRRLGIPSELVADLSAAQEVSHRVLVEEVSAMSHASVASLKLPVEAGMRIMAVRRRTEWITDIDGDFVLLPDDALFLRGSPDGIHQLRELAGAHGWQPPEAAEDTWITDLDRAVDALVEMKNLSEAAVGLAYSALVFSDKGLAAEVCNLEGRLDEMKAQLQLWVLRAGSQSIDPSLLRGLLMVATAAEDIGDQAKQMVWLVERGVHPVVALALGESDEVVVRFVVQEGSDAAGKTLRELQLRTEPGFLVFAIRRGDRYIYRPRGGHQLKAGDEVIAHGPEEGREPLAAYFEGLP